MSQNQLPPPESEACLFRLRSSSQKGGTLIAEEVTDHATHERRICDPDGYRLPFCPRCGKGPLHVHDYRERVLRAELRKPVALIVRLICVSCEAIWQILPLFIARHLWRTWNVVRNALRPDHRERKNRSLATRRSRSAHQCAAGARRSSSLHRGSGRAATPAAGRHLCAALTTHHRIVVLRLWPRRLPGSLSPGSCGSRP